MPLFAPPSGAIVSGFRTCPVRLSEVESEQKEMLKTVRRLVDEGQIVMATGAADEFV